MRALLLSQADAFPSGALAVVHLLQTLLVEGSCWVKEMPQKGVGGGLASLC